MTTLNYVFLSLNDSCLSVFSQKTSGYIVFMFFGDRITLDSAEKRSDSTEDILAGVEYRKPGKQNIPYETSIGVVFSLKIMKRYSYPPTVTSQTHVLTIHYCAANTTLNIRE